MCLFLFLSQPTKRIVKDKKAHRPRRQMNKEAENLIAYVS